MSKKSMDEANLTPEEVAVLKKTIDDTVIVYNDIKIMQEGVKDAIQEASEELNIKESDIREAAKTIFQQNINKKKQKQKALEKTLSAIGIDLNSDEDDD